VGNQKGGAGHHLLFHASNRQKELKKKDRGFYGHVNDMATKITTRSTRREKRTGASKKRTISRKGGYAEKRIKVTEDRLKQGNGGGIQKIWLQVTS